MITEDYVSFETAKLLKEKGFPQDDTRILSTCYKYNGKFCNNVKSMSRVDREICYMAPTLQMAMKWLREQYNIHITIYPVDKRLRDKFGKYEAVLYDIENDVEVILQNFGIFGYHIYGGTPEDATEKAIKYCLEHLIKKC